MIVVHENVKTLKWHFLHNNGFFKHIQQENAITLWLYLHTFRLISRDSAIAEALHTSGTLHWTMDGWMVRV